MRQKNPTISNYLPLPYKKRSFSVGLAKVFCAKTTLGLNACEFVTDKNTDALSAITRTVFCKQKKQKETHTLKIFASHLPSCCISFVCIFQKFFERKISHLKKKKKQALTECDAFLTARQVLIYCLKLVILLVGTCNMTGVRKYCTHCFNSLSTQVLIY